MICLLAEAGRVEVEDEAVILHPQVPTVIYRGVYGYGLVESFLVNAILKKPG